MIQNIKIDNFFGFIQISIRVCVMAPSVKTQLWTKQHSNLCQYLITLPLLRCFDCQKQVGSLFVKKLQQNITSKQINIKLWISQAYSISKNYGYRSKYVTDETRAVKPSSYGATTVTSSTRGNASTERADLATMLPDVNDGSSKKVKTG